MVQITSPQVQAEPAAEVNQQLALPAGMSSAARSIADSYRDNGGVHVAAEIRGLERPLQYLLSKCSNHEASDAMSMHLKAASAAGIQNAINALPAIAAGLGSAVPHKVVGALQLFEKHQAVLTTAASVILPEDHANGSFIRRTVERVSDAAARLLRPHAVA